MKHRMAMLNHANRHFVLLLITLVVGCNQQEQKEKRNYKILELSKRVIGNQEYDRVRQLALDSLRIWGRAKLPGYMTVWSHNYRLDSILCFNSERDRMVTAILIPCHKPSCQTDNIHYFYGAKIKNKWYFFQGGGAMVIIREHYQKDIRTPVSFKKLHELAMDEMLRGYIKKNEKGTWEINDAFFISLMENVGWGDYKRYQDTVVYGKRYVSKKEYFESIYLDVAKGAWIRE